MKKLLFLLGIILVVSSPVAFAHPYLDSASINGIADPNSEIKIFGLDKTYQKEINPEFFSDQWIIENFVWILLGAIGIFMGIFTLIIYREEFRSVKI